jgi:hypothetical protein
MNGNHRVKEEDQIGNDMDRRNERAEQKKPQNLIYKEQTVLDDPLGRKH